jgi:hypothetical protein
MVLKTTCFDLSRSSSEFSSWRNQVQFICATYVVVVCLIGVCVCVRVCVRARSYRIVLPDQRVLGFCDFFLCHYCPENRVSVTVCLSRVYVFFCSGSPGNVLFFYGDHIFPFVSDMWHVCSVSYCVMCSVLMGVRISIFFLVDLHLLCWNYRIRTLKRSTPILYL